MFVKTIKIKKKKNNNNNNNNNSGKKVIQRRMSAQIFIGYRYSNII